MLAMAAALVGCSQEELVIDNNKVASGNLEARPAIGSVTVGVGVASRMALAEGSSINIDYVEGDQVGAAIIDMPILEGEVYGKPAEEKVSGEQDYSNYGWTYSQYLKNYNYGTDEEPITYETAGLTSKDFYETVEYISSNYPYTYSADGFKTQANLVEGNYLFYMPYNEKHLLRNRIEAVLPQVQDASDEVMRQATYCGEKKNSSSTTLDQFYKGTIENAEKAPVLVGYKFLEAPKDGSVIEPQVKMTHLFAYPLITIKNDFEGWFFGEASKSTAYNAAKTTMTIDSVQVYYAGQVNPMFWKAPINSAQLADVLAEEGEWDGMKLSAGAPTSDLLDANAVENYYQVNGLGPKNEMANEYLYNQSNRITCLVGKELATGEAYGFRVILPAANYGHELMARVYVTIDGKQYVLANATVANTWTSAAKTDYTTALSEIADFAFVDEVNGNQACELVRGQQYPKAEIREDGKGLKGFAGTMMTISLAKASAFELDKIVEEVVNDYGLKTNEELIEYLVNNVQRGVNINEYASLRNKKQASWKTEEPIEDVQGNAAAGNLAFAEDNTIIINAQLIKDLKLQTIVNNEDVMLFLNDAVLPIANDVKITKINGNEYTFATLDESVSYVIVINSTINTDGEALVDGINKINGTVTLKADEDATVANAVVMVESGEVTYASTTTGVNAIYVANGATLNVEAACNAMIIAETGSTINIKANGSLANDNNEFTGATINNSYERVINGTLEETTVKANYAASWPTTAIAANTRINDITINTSAATTEQSPLAIEQAQIDIFKNLSNVTLTLGGNIQHIVSVADVELTNLFSLTASATWTTTSNTGIKVKTFQWGENETDVTSVTGVSTATGVTIQ